MCGFNSCASAVVYLTNYALTIILGNFRVIFHIRLFSREQTICNVMLSKSLLVLLDLSECHFT